jgi:hypothetical protein
MVRLTGLCLTSRGCYVGWSGEGDAFTEEGEAGAAAGLGFACRAGAPRCPIQGEAAIGCCLR